MLTQQKVHQMKPMLKKLWEETKPALIPLQIFFGFALAIYFITFLVWQIGI